MKLKELIENEQPKVVLRTNNYDEYSQFMEKQSSPDNRYFFEEIPSDGSDELYDIVVDVFSFSRSPQTRMDPESVDIDWDIKYYGSGDTGDNNFYIIEGRIDLSQKDFEDIEQRLMEDQDEQKSNEYDDRGDYERTLRKDEPDYF